VDKFCGHFGLLQILAISRRNHQHHDAFLTFNPYLVTELTNNVEKTRKTAQEEHKWKRTEHDHVKKDKKKKPKNKKSSEAESFNQMNILYTTHFKMAM
jgi:hypothetical protein